ncbi:hypothetical protein MCOR27_003393 [Pyricularia oryzae]|uniref:Uncharacterized protein n=2 Tax=Pyricularia TaxID=48558 RepID=A0ABQ8NP01_PYRGI|nr:hypothetical protein MCOR02_000512 [Pyricularia oryzae]KAI6299885.1 hypothetical protein MCOR33_004273 [Pyricularia grisea]KAI6263266.1 hypothetical protein MCOR19_000592 [Pyricularia oryzae]KAI6273275.1 hypothetical protein MCOR26_006994 [Pyricularia oryzae]KAI6283227.1 hypothetical protein MCOR27_003393 [Pyricularia oryzae]
MEDESQPSLPSFPALNNPRLRFNQAPPAHLFTDSSEPAAFSSDDDPSLESYSHHGRRKKRRIGSWFHQSSQQQLSSDPPFPEFVEGAASRPKAIAPGAPRQLRRDMDSGVWLASDDTVDKTIVPDEPTAAQAPSPLVPRVASGLHRCASIRNISPEESLAQKIIQDCIEEGDEDVNIASLGLESIAASTIQPLSGFQLIPTVVEDVPFEARDIKLKLYLGNNRLARVPASICDLSFLTVLSLRGNGLKELPPGISQLRNLEQLNIAQNALRWLPHELLELITTSKKLEFLSLHPNPYCQPESNRDAGQTPEYRTISFSEGASKRDSYATWSAFSGIAGSHGGCLVARSPMQYVDGLGRPCNTDIVNLDEGSWLPAADLYSEPAKPPATFDDAPPTRARSLLELALESCSQASTSTSTDLRSLMPDTSPAHLLELLDRIDQLRDAGPQRCARPGCAKRQSMVIPRVQWLDWWVLGKYHIHKTDKETGQLVSEPEGAEVQGTDWSINLAASAATLVPFMSKGCSWRCVPEVPEKTMPTPKCDSIMIVHRN